ncbi:MAG TPA: galactokinase [Limnochordia bacterium]|mgnify:FL=1|jgi:galactokinase|nr:galactokinase [Limnochordia bacterium]HPT92590.1 galactokinase [Limnochordia bacterium]HPZ30546.1 galactokinase [Limnochordia bacterium]HXK96458.1 galactokinase [Limnochordia bacterium]
MTVHELVEAFRRQFPDAGEPIVVRAPGRVNLIGEHTDYNDGYVLPMAIDAQIMLAGSLRDDQEVHLYSLDFQSGDRFSLGEIQRSTKATWTNYIRGVCSMFLEFTPLKGMNIVLTGNVPQGAGLSSSAALEVGTALLIRNLNGLDTDAVELAKLAQRAENEFVGVNCGIMDQFISGLGKQGHVLFLDCRSLEYELVPAPFADKNASVVVIDSGVKRGLVSSEYNLRRSQCEAAVRELQKDLPQIRALRDVGAADLVLVEKLPPDLCKRARHVITENQRVLDAVKYLAAGDLRAFGLLMNQSHASLRNDYEVSCQELDLLVELAQSVPGTYGSRMTGAGFGGCTVSLVDNDYVGQLKAVVMEQYPAQSGLKPRIFVFNASEGAQQLV